MSLFIFLAFFSFFCRLFVFPTVCLPSLYQKISSCFISSFSICSCSDSFYDLFFSTSPSSPILKPFFHSKKNLSLLLCTCFLYSFFKHIFLCFSCCSLVCFLFPLFTMRFCTLSSCECPSFFF